MTHIHRVIIRENIYKCECVLLRIICIYKINDIHEHIQEHKKWINKHGKVASKAK